MRTCITSIKKSQRASEQAARMAVKKPLLSSDERKRQAQRQRELRKEIATVERKIAAGPASEDS